MATEAMWLVTLDRPDEPDGGPFAFEALDDAIDHMRDRHNEEPILWARSDIGLIGPAHAPEPAPKKKRAQRKRRDSTGAVASDGTTPGPSSTAAASVDVRPEGAAGTSHAAERVTGAPIPDPRHAAGTQSGQPRPSCGGKACETRGGIDVHRMDASCSKFTATKRGAAAR